MERMPSFKPGDWVVRWLSDNDRPDGQRGWSGIIISAKRKNPGDEPHLYEIQLVGNRKGGGAPDLITFVRARPESLTCHPNLANVGEALPEVDEFYVGQRVKLDDVFSWPGLGSILSIDNGIVRVKQDDLPYQPAEHGFEAEEGEPGGYIDTLPKFVYPLEN